MAVRACRLVPKAPQLRDHPGTRLLNKGHPRPRDRGIPGNRCETPPWHGSGGPLLHGTKLARRASSAAVRTWFTPSRPPSGRPPAGGTHRWTPASGLPTAAVPRDDGREDVAAGAIAPPWQEPPLPSPAARAISVPCGASRLQGHGDQYGPPVWVARPDVILPSGHPGWATPLGEGDQVGGHLIPTLGASSRFPVNPPQPSMALSSGAPPSPPSQGLPGRGSGGSRSRPAQPATRKRRRR
jgi:hypothetical protein